MTIYNPGDLVFFILNSLIYQATVVQTTIVETVDDSLSPPIATDVTYKLTSVLGTTVIPGLNVFGDLDSLIESLVQSTIYLERK